MNDTGNDFNVLLENPQDLAQAAVPSAPTAIKMQVKAFKTMVVG